MKFTLLAILIALATTSKVNNDERVKVGGDVIEAMFSKYKGKWYKTLTFVQQTSFYKNGKLDREQTWYEAMDIKKGLVIKFDSISSGSGLLFKSDSQFVYKNNKLINKTRRVHELIVLGFSVYFDDPKVTLEKLKEAGYNLDVLKTEIENERKVYVVGDSENAQFWIDAETLLFTHLRKKQSDGTVSEVAFKEYKKLGKGWLESEVIFYKNGEVTMREVYKDIRSPKKLPKNLFNQPNFKSIVW